MLTCIECRCSILHRHVDTETEPRHGLCMPCFTRRLEGARNQNLWALSDVDIELLQQDALILDNQMKVVGVNDSACKRFKLRPVRVRGRALSDAVPALAVPAIMDWCQAEIDSPKITQKAMEGYIELPDGETWALVVLTAGRGRASVAVDFTWHNHEISAEDVPVMGQVVRM